jgi:hypothetical protein
VERNADFAGALGVVVSAMKLLLLVSLSCAFFHATASADTVVLTDHGVFKGHQAPNVSDVVEFLGIPYAQPPVGYLRFKSPAAIKDKQDVVASSYVSSITNPKSPRALLTKSTGFVRCRHNHTHNPRL